jgi:hypothetical protein
MTIHANDPAGPSDAELERAFRAGRADEKARAPRRDAVSDKIADKATKDAYERGRRDERARRPVFSLVALALVVAAVVGGGMVYLAAREGSFTRGGEVLDSNLNSASQTAQAPIRNAAAKAGDALENAGQSLKQQVAPAPAPSAPAPPPAQ